MKKIAILVVTLLVSLGAYADGFIPKSISVNHGRSAVSSGMELTLSLEREGHELDLTFEKDNAYAIYAWKQGNLTVAASAGLMENTPCVGGSWIRFRFLGQRLVPE